MYAIYRLAPIGVNGTLEAEGVEYWACNAQHARQLSEVMTTPFAIEADDNAIASTACAICGATEAHK